jgi:elongation factor 1-gamma
MSDKVIINVVPVSSRCSSAIITALVTKANFEIKVIPHASMKGEEYLKIHPYGKVPSAVTPEGPLFESNTISRYFARKSGTHYGKNSHEQTLVDQWLDNIRMDIAPHNKVAYSIFGWASHLMTKEEFETGLAEFVKTLKVVDGHLKTNQFLVGNELSIADIVLVCDLSYGYRWLFTEAERKALPNLTAYFDRLVKIAEFKTVLGNIPHIDARPNIKFACKKEQHQKKEEKPKAAAPKKEEKKPAPKKEVKEEDDEPKEPKVVEHKFPETAFNLHDFKTLYVNEPDKSKALEFLWKNWDNNAFSFWRIRYDKLPSEGQVVYLTNNLMNGFMDRADACRKHALGVLGVYGDEPNLDIRGVWMWRGTDVNPYMLEHPQFEYWERRKLDVNNAEDRALITEYWTKLTPDTDTVEGLTARTIKIYK